MTYSRISGFSVLPTAAAASYALTVYRYLSLFTARQPAEYHTIHYITTLSSRFIMEISTRDLTHCYNEAVKLKGQVHILM